jgi:hypothetical protein
MAERSEAKLRVKISQILIFDAKLRFALFASLRSAIFRENKASKKLVALPAGIKPCEKSDQLIVNSFVNYAKRLLIKTL